jgi:hypothetical protein
MDVSMDGFQQSVDRFEFRLGFFGCVINLQLTFEQKIHPRNPVFACPGWAFVKPVLSSLATNSRFVGGMSTVSK